MKWILLALFSTQLFAQDFKFDKETGKSIPNFVAEITIFKGKVFKMTKDKKEKVQKGTRFFKSDTVVTENASFVKLKIVDETTMALGPNSQMNFEEYEFVEKDDRKIVYGFIKGQLKGHFKTKAEEGDITVKTKTAAMGIRGTKILVNHQNIGDKELSEFALLSGSAFIIDKKKKRHDIKRGDHLITVTDALTQKSALDKRKLPETLMAKLDVQAEVEPLMPMITFEGLKKGSNVHQFFAAGSNKASTSPASQSAPVERRDDEKWRNNLKKLNRKLRENY